MNDLEILKRVTEMCEESCSPQQIEVWNELQDYLFKVRISLQKLEEDYEFSQKVEGGYFDWNNTE